MVSVKTLCLVLMFVLTQILEETEADVEFYCPDGSTFRSERKDVWSNYNRNCQCDCCPYTKRWECSDLPGSIRSTFEGDGFGQLNMKFACMVHDYCYATYGKTQKTCDEEFQTNARRVCRSSYLRDVYSFGTLSCPAVAGYAYAAVRAQDQKMEEKWEKCPDDCYCGRTKLQQAEANANALIDPFRSFFS